jgi:thiosulfate dehydrogenase (quinone) large subunit
MELQRERSGARGAGFEDPALLRAVLADPRLAWLWLVLRVSLGSLWFEAGRRQLQSAVGIGGAGEPWVAQALAVFQTLAGIALILGAFVGLAAFTGGVVGSGLLPATAGVMTPLLFTAVVVLVLAWKTAGWIGLDRWLLPLLGMPWRGGALFDERTEQTRVSESRRQS